jgi:hypothetical protein
VGKAAPGEPAADWSNIDLWLEKGDGESPDGPVAALTPETQKILLAAAITDAKRLRGRSWSNHWPDAVAVAVFVVFAILGICQHFSHAPVMQLAVAVPGGLQAYHVITNADLVERSAPPAAGAQSNRSAVSGRYLLQYLKQGAVLHDAQLSRTSDWNARLKDRIVVDLPVRLGPSEPPRETTVTLIVAPRRKDVPAVLPGDVPLLAIRRTTNAIWATVALTSDQLGTIKPLLGDADIFLGRPGH